MLIHLLLLKDVLDSLMREMCSHPVTGEYDFSYIDELILWSITSYDHNGMYKAVTESDM